MVSSHGTEPDFSRKLADEHTAQDFAVKELDIHIVWLSRGKKQELGRADLGSRNGKGSVGLQGNEKSLARTGCRFFPQTE